MYLQLRGLDTVEDDMNAFAGGGPELAAAKLAHLRNFHTYLQVRACTRMHARERSKRV